MTCYKIICSLIKSLYVELHPWLLHYMYHSCRLNTRVDHLCSTTCGYEYV